MEYLLIEKGSKGKYEKLRKYILYACYGNDFSSIVIPSLAPFSGSTVIEARNPFSIPTRFE